MKITVYQKPTCTTCRQVHAALREAGVDFEAVDYYTDPIPKTKLRELLRKMGIPARALLRTKEDIYKRLRLGEKDLTDDQILDLMVEHPDLIQRPIVEKGSRAILARPAERIKEILAAVLVLFVVSWPLVAQGQTADSTGRAERRLPAVRATAAIRIDGSLDEPDWAAAPLARGFIQNDPREGEPATEDTDVRVLYDATNIYFGVFAHDREPRAILTSELTKDFNRESGDDFEIVLDTFHDERNGYVFATNAHGAKWDAQMINEGLEVNENWDALWDVATRITETGWYAEIVIPFRTLRFRSGDEQTWGINFQRRIRRRNEDSFWAPVPRIYDLQRVSLAGTLEGLQGVRPGNDLRVKPYVLGSAGTSTRADVGTDAQAGVDVKYGVTSGDRKSVV